MFLVLSPDVLLPVEKTQSLSTNTYSYSDPKVHGLVTTSGNMVFLEIYIIILPGKKSNSQLSLRMSVKVLWLFLIQQLTHIVITQP